MLEQLKICSPYVRQTRPLCCWVLWLRCAGGVGKSAGSVDKSVGLLHLYTLRNALKISLVQTKSAGSADTVQTK